ncbi:uncharacterized protein RAG0_10778 [Rhynchosporium agropyri]|uniref:Uncharacterized protein n=1 Tax=Rhynchosporium agropyri TaxID=914238 RepID=A0A1E1L191_9HELO|nr:uncharacterized protein RAG0_10778 [Rhynchosporium agropyri]
MLAVVKELFQPTAIHHRVNLGFQPLHLEECWLRVNVVCDWPSDPINQISRFE